MPTTQEKKALILAPGHSAIVAGILVTASLYSWAVIALTQAHPGAIGLNFNSLGTDWMVFYGADLWVYAGNIDRIFDGEALTAFLNTTFSHWLSEPMPFRPWVYPPTYLLMVLPFGRLSFPVSFAVFQLATALLLGIALWLRADQPKARLLVIGAALVGPAAAVNFGFGQNAFLTAAMLVGGLRLLAVRRAWAGIVLGLLTVKPQFWLLVPVALIAAREWRALAWAVFAGFALAAISVAFFGLDPWWQWLDVTRNGFADATSKWVELGRLWGVSVYACLANAGLPDGVANAGQTVAMAMAAGLVYWGFRLPLPGDQKIAVLLCCTLLAAPHSSASDTVWLAVAAGLAAGALMQAEAPLSAWIPALALWLAPFFDPPEIRPVGRLLPLLLIGFPVAVILRFRARAGGDRSGQATVLVAPRGWETDRSREWWSRGGSNPS
jgi:alpha-1,2-mannosyltransferase